MTNNENDKKAPKHVGIIMDGNRRWARERNLPTMEGHLKGYQALKAMPDWFFNRGVKIISTYAFSTENWNRSQDEVNYLMKLLRNVLLNDLDEFDERGYSLRLSGRINELPGDLPEICQNAVDKTKNNAKGILNICLNYGGRAEISDAIVKIIKKGLKPEQIHEGMIKKYLYNGDLGDPDIIVRTSGEQRLSGFMLWESAYSELLFMKKYWPDFEEIDAEFIVEEYKKRKRRFGGDA